MCFLLENKLNVAIITLQECSQCTLVKHPLSPGSVPLSQQLTKMALFSPPLPSPLSLSLSLSRLSISLPPSYSHLLSSIPVLLSLSQSMFLFSTFTFSLFFVDSGFFPYLPLLSFCLENHISGLPCFILFMLCNCLFSPEENLYGLYRK